MHVLAKGTRRYVSTALRFLCDQMLLLRHEGRSLERQRYPCAAHCETLASTQTILDLGAAVGHTTVRLCFTSVQPRPIKSSAESFRKLIEQLTGNSESFVEKAWHMRGHHW